MKGRQRHRSRRTDGPASGRFFLFVGGPFGPFFRKLARLLQAEGATVLHIHMHGADWLDWGFGDAKTYRGHPDDWRSWLTALLDSEPVTDVVTYGDCGRYSTVLLEEAESRGLIRHVYELGYVRPYYITLDRNGVNGYSSLPRDPMQYRLAKEPTVMPATKFGRMMPYHVFHTIAHCLAHYAAKPFFRHYDPNWPSSPLKQALGYLTRVTMDKLTWRRQRKAERDVISGNAPFFLCALQKSGDTQIDEHSRFRNVVQFINHVTESFANFAPPDAKLVFKAHPLDYGIEPQETAVRVAGKANGVLDRLVFLPTGSLTDLMAAAKGMVTVNSTAGLTAALRGLPTAIAGEAFYKIEGLVSTNGIDGFWTNPKRPDWNIAERFLAVAAAKTQINGSYYSPRGRQMALPVAEERMLARTGDDPEHDLNRRAERKRQEATQESGSGPDTPGARPWLA